MFSFGPGSKPVNEDWQAFRRKAERTATSIDQFSDIDKERYDLEELDLGGRLNPKTYRTNDRPIDGEGQGDSFDVRDLPTR